MRSLVTSIVFWCVWQWMAAANVRDRVRHRLRWERGPGTVRREQLVPLRFSPAWGVGAWFVPFANLMIPYLAITEIWDRSHALDGSRGPLRGIVKAWWFVWLLPVFVWGAVILLPRPGGHEAFTTLLEAVTVFLALRGVALSALAIFIVWRITLRQEAWPPVDLDALAGPRS